MKGGKTPIGYTIVELMMVLAISSLMFLIAATFINGKHERTSFTAGVNELASKIQDVYDQVINGKYSDEPISCNYNSSTNTTTLGAISGSQGQHTQCVFLGKMIHMPIKTIYTKYEILTIVGGRLDANNNEITNLIGLINDDPRAVMDPALQITQVTPQQLLINNIEANVFNGNVFVQKQTFAFGFIQSQGTTAVGQSSLISGSQVINFYDDKTLIKSTNDVFTYTDGTILSNNLEQNTQVDICVTDNTQYADIIIGNSGSATNSNNVVDIKWDGKNKSLSSVCI
ncbi:MAG TPA: hypothetical protein VLF63_02485 [Patescibacteria group bacterium]|nr:hypothetical protein [Patescibacteria group bacterium]